MPDASGIFEFRMIIKRLDIGTILGTAAQIRICLEKRLPQGRRENHYFLGDSSRYSDTRVG
jgi:hypothetical protein